MKRAISIKSAVYVTTLVSLLWLTPVGVFAHCDGLDGPVVKAAQKALAETNVNLVLIWVQKDDEAQIKQAFEKTLAVRKLNPEARELADMSFFETLVRIHRAGEGAPYTGLKPAGRDLGPAIPAGDKALETGDLEPVVKLLSGKIEHGVHEHFNEALAKKKFDKNNVEAAREFVRAYVEYIHYVEGIHDTAAGATHGHFPEAEAAAAPSPVRQLVDYRSLAFQPHVWEQQQVSTMLLPWTGSNIVFLTTNGTYDAVLMSRWVSRLDQAWALYANLTGARPRPLKQLDGRATIAAVPGFEFTCGAGCGYVGSSGIELAMFYGWNYPALRKNTNAMPHYVFYEMGRNFFTLGDRHSAFTTGFAVFMRYVCMDALGCVDEEPKTRQIIEAVEPLIRTGHMSFLKTFTNADGLSEKEPRVKDAAGRWIDPSDQPVTYASAMLRLRREHGGNDWVRRCFHALAQCPPAPENTREGALAQSWNWLIAASLAARKDLSPVFVEDWRLPLSTKTRKELAAVDWASPEISAPAIWERIQPSWEMEP